jgi:uncharacterized protein
MGRHHSHPEILKRLRRIQGHVGKIVAMIEAQTPCPDVAQQMQAVEKAMTSAKRAFIEDHLAHCFDEDVLLDPRRRRAEIEAFKSITKYL